MFCKNCGEPLPENAVFCHKCGTKTGFAETSHDEQQNNREAETSADSQQPEQPVDKSDLNSFSQSEQPSESIGRSLNTPDQPDQETVEMEQEPVHQQITLETKLRAFVGENQDYYVSKWLETDPPGKKIWFNFAAFFLNAYWLVYRKMYILPALIYIPMTVLFLLLYLVGVPFIALSIVLVLLGWSASAFIGIMGNRLYFNHAKKKINGISSAKASEVDEIEQIRKKGGTSVIAIFVFMGINALVSIFTGIVVVIFLLFPSSIEFGSSLESVEREDYSAEFASGEEIYYSVDFKLPTSYEVLKLSIFDENDEEVLSWSETVDDFSTGVYGLAYSEEADAILLEEGTYTLQIVDSTDSLLAEGDFTVEQ